MLSYCFTLQLFSGPQAHLFKFMVATVGVYMIVPNGEDLSVN